MTIQLLIIVILTSPITTPNTAIVAKEIWSPSEPGLWDSFSHKIMNPPNCPMWVAGMIPHNPNHYPYTKIMKIYLRLFLSKEQFQMKGLQQS